MNSNNLETGPKPLTRSEILRIGDQVRGPNPIYVGGTNCVANEGRFNKYGIFSVISGDEPKNLGGLELTEEGKFPLGRGVLHWGSRLMDLDPENWRLRWLNATRSFIATDQTNRRI